ncbi:Alkaline phosphatase synthesis transcriptional regulatory protein PhoP [subsurface metagenome]
MERILIIEGEPNLRGELASALTEAGFSVIKAGNVLEGLKKAYGSRPDLAIMASELPLVNGVLYLRQTSYLPILVLGNYEEMNDMLELGADAYMTKPPSLVELVSRVRSLLRRKPRHDPRSDN